MTIDYKKLGLKAGLEIHQQLNTHKLFCSCPSMLRSDAPAFIVERILHPVTGETGAVDAAALFEKAKEKQFTYHVYDTNCLVELDEEPPHNINPEALQIALQIALLLNCTIFPVTQVMRKTVIDGSNTSGFQRTVLIAHDGFIETSSGKVRIDTIALEEDSARKIDDTQGKRTYSLDRLGMPLVEITTAPDLTSAEQVKEAALKIGEILRACEVKRGLGTIRQDVNVSSKGAHRVEIKGFQDPKLMVKTVDYEVLRQQKLAELQSQFTKKQSHKLYEVTECVKASTAPLITNGLKEGKNVFGGTLSGLKGILGTELQPGKRIGSDIADYAKHFSDIGGIIHSDEDLEKKYRLTNNEVKAVREKLGVNSSDAFILLVSTPSTAHEVWHRVHERLGALKGGNPKEVRQANSDGTTTFLRPMPGAARMYPETDCTLLRIKKQTIDELKKNLPKVASEHKKYLAAFGLNDELIKLLLKEHAIEAFKDFSSQTDHYDTIAKALTIFKKEIIKKEGITKQAYDEKVPNTVLAKLFNAIGEIIAPHDVKPVLQRIVQGESLEQALEKKAVNLDEAVKTLLKAKPNLSEGAYMGLIMNQFKGQVSGKEVAKTLQKYLTP